MSNERTPLINTGVCGLSVTSVACGAVSDGSPESNPGSPSKDPRKLNTFFGVMVPTILSMFSIVLFLRTGERRNKKHKIWFWVVRRCTSLSHCTAVTNTDMISLCRLCGWSRRVDTGSFNGSCSLHHHFSYNTVHLCHLHQRCHTRWWSLLYPYKPNNFLKCFLSVSCSFIHLILNIIPD